MTRFFADQMANLIEHAIPGAEVPALWRKFFTNLERNGFWDGPLPKELVLPKKTDEP